MFERGCYLTDVCGRLRRTARRLAWCAILNQEVAQATLFLHLKQQIGARIILEIVLHANEALVRIHALQGSHFIIKNALVNLARTFGN